MKFTINKDNFQHALKGVRRAVANRTSLPVLQNVLIETDDSSLKMTGMDMEIGIKISVGAQVESPGSITVPARLLAEFVSSLPSGSEIAAEMNADLMTITLHSGNFRASLNGIHSDEFPLIKAFEDVEESFSAKIDIPFGLLKEMVSRTSFAASKDIARPTFTGILFKSHDGLLTFAASDGFRLSFVSAEFIAPEVGVIIPQRSFHEFIKLAELEKLKKDDIVSIGVAENMAQIVFHVPGVDLVSQIIEANYPDVQKVIPDNYSVDVSIGKNDMLGAVKLVNVFASRSVDIATIDIRKDDGEVVFSANAPDFGSNETKVEAKINGTSLLMAVNGKYLYEAVSVVSGPNVHLRFISDTRPLLIYEDTDQLSYIHLIMPMKRL